MILYTNDNKSKKIYVSESQLKNINEDVFVSGLKRKKANLSYNKRQSDKRIRNLGNYNSFDMLDTGKMDQDNNDTYIVPLKGGINSYNITSIKGTEVMHYFKNKFMNKKTNIKIDVNGEKSEYELAMEDEEFDAFLNTFNRKVSNVVNYVSKELAAKDKDFKGFKGVSIYPVPSSSNFNRFMVGILERYNIGISNLPCQQISDVLFKKDLSNLQKDISFINKNKDYYNDRYFANGEDTRSHASVVDDELKKFKETTSAQDINLINNYNMWVNRVITSYHTKVSPQKLANNYVNLVNARNAIREKLGHLHWDKVFKKIKYAKGPSVEARTTNIQNIVASVLGNAYVYKNNIDIVEISPKAFEIKNLSNDIRMGMKNYFQPQNGIEEELEKIQGTVFVIFDDNISGGATLSDICYQAKKLGIKYIIPITFGKMQEKYSFKTMKINAPEKWNY